VNAAKADVSIPRVEKVLFENLVPIVTFLCLIVGASAGASIHIRSPSKQIGDDTVHLIRIIVNILVVMTSIALGLMLNSAKTSFDTNRHNLHGLTTEIILLDRALRALGPEADEPRRHLVAYVKTALGEANLLDVDPQAEASLEAACASLRAIKVADDRKAALWNDARAMCGQVIRVRWVFVDAAGDTIPWPLLIALIIWQMLIFAGLGIRAPRNAFVSTAFIAAALVLSSVLFLILEMDRPGSGLIQLGRAPFERALAQLQK
jgi:hypothetical protein